MAEAREPVAWEQSAHSTNRSMSDKLPSEVATCLQNARFLHLATCTQNIPHVSLMNYTYLPSHPFPPSSRIPTGPVILMTSNPSSKKTANLITNPHVSILVHDWVSSRPPNTSTSGREASPSGAPRSSLAAMLMQMNSTAVSNISATINGEACVLDAGTEEERWCKEQHLRNNTFDAESTDGGVLRRTSSGVEGDEGRGAYIEDDEVRLVVVKIRDGRISDWKGGVKDWAIAEQPAERENADGGGGAQRMVNGTGHA